MAERGWVSRHLLRGDRNRELDEEIRAHIAMAVRERIERGEDPKTAELGARREFGNQTLVREITREVWAWTSIDRLWQDIRYAFRGMRRSPGFTAVVVVSLALGIGVNTAIFSLISALLLRLVPAHQPEQLVEFLAQYPGDPALNVFSQASHEHFRNHSRAFSDITGTQPSRFLVRGAGRESEVVYGESVIGNYFELLGMSPALGRLLIPADSSAAVISHSYWSNRFNKDPAILGRQLVVDNVPMTVVGVAPRNFFGLRVGQRCDLWIPRRNGANPAPVALLARLRPDVSIEQARAEMAVLFRFALEERTRGNRDPLNHQIKFSVAPAAGGLSTGLRDLFAKPLLALMVIVGLLLLIACSNLASILLARAASRQREMAVRIALGASRFRLVRQVLTESLLLSGVGALAGLVVAWFGAAALVKIMTSGRPIVGMPRIDIPLTIDPPVLIFTGAIALLTGLLFGLAPARYASTVTPASSLRERPSLFRKGLVVVQVALSVSVLSAAGLFIDHLSNLRSIDLGFSRDNVLLVDLDASQSGYSAERLSLAYEELLRRVQTIPGVTSAALCGPSPMSGAGASRFVNVEGRAERPEDRRHVSVSWVAPRYFETLKTPLLAGRDFRFEDRGRTPVAIINRTMAAYYFPGASPIGKRFTFDRGTTSYEIIGVVGDAKYSEIREQTRRAVYLSAFQARQPASTLAIRTSIEPEAITPALRRLVDELLKSVAIAKVTTLAEQVDASILPERLVATLSGGFAVLGSLLTAIGIYGLLAYTVARRTNEIGLRMALGATRRSVSVLVLRQAMGMTCAGLAIGVPLAYSGKRMATGLITGLPDNGMFPVLIGIVVIIAFSAVAAYVPARRATRVDPMVALRHE